MTECNAEQLEFQPLSQRTVRVGTICRGAAAGAFNWYLNERPITHPPGITVPEEPELLPGTDEPWTDDNGLSYQSLGRLRIRARHIHTIPSTPEIADQIARMRPGQILTLDGELVALRDALGRRRLSSSTVLGDRECEIMWVESIELED